MRPHTTTDGVIVFAGLDWWYHNRAHADFQLARRLAERDRVLLVNSIGVRMPRVGTTTSIGRRIRNKARSVFRGVRRPVPGLDGFYVYSPLVLPLYGSAWGRRLATALVTLQVTAVRRWLRLATPAIVVTPPTAWPVARRMRHRVLAYNRSDKHSAFDESRGSALREYESDLLRSADLVLYVSTALQEEEQSIVGGRSVYLDHGVDLDLFDPNVPEARELAKIARPIVGYFGALRDHVVDVDLLTRVADALPNVSLVLVGPSTMDLRALRDRPNVHVLGPQPHERIPSFGVAFDVAIMPWLDNDWIRNCNPIKMKEYLALGLPVVTTEFPEAARWPVAVARDSDEFLTHIRAAIRWPGDADARRTAVAKESWDARAQTLEELLR